jgi:translin
MHNFSRISEQAEQAFEARTKARDQALVQARQLTRLSAQTIRAIHRSESEPAHALLNEARQIVESLKKDLTDFPDLYFAGYTQDASKEVAEASTTCALIENTDLPGAEELGIEISTYINGLAEAIGELRRRCLDILRQGYSEEAERLLGEMDEIYNFLVTMDYPDAVTNGLRRQTDLARGIIERTRADLTMSLREQHLQEALQEFASQFPGSKSK